MGQQGRIVNFLEAHRYSIVDLAVIIVIGDIFWAAIGHLWKRWTHRPIHVPNGTIKIDMSAAGLTRKQRSGLTTALKEIRTEMDAKDRRNRAVWATRHGAA